MRHLTLPPAGRSATCAGRRDPPGCRRRPASPAACWDSASLSVDQLGVERRRSATPWTTRPAAGGLVGPGRTGGARRVGRRAPADAARGIARAGSGHRHAAARRRYRRRQGPAGDACLGRAGERRRMLPDTVQVRLLERQPLALWQRDGRFEVIDRAGAVIEGAVNDRPQEYGTCASWSATTLRKARPRLFALLSTEPALSARVVAATRVGGRRWNVHSTIRSRSCCRNGTRSAPGDCWRRRRATMAAGPRDHRIDLRFLPERLRLRLDPAALPDHDT